MVKLLSNMKAIPKENMTEISLRKWKFQSMTIFSSFHLGDSIYSSDSSLFLPSLIPLELKEFGTIFSLLHSVMNASEANMMFAIRALNKSKPYHVIFYSLFGSVFVFGYCLRIFDRYGSTNKFLDIFQMHQDRVLKFCLIHFGSLL
jgi:hypothetical protein